MSDDSDGIEIVEKEPGRSRDYEFCQLCSTNLHGLSTTERDDHYSRHESGVHIGSRVTSKRGRPKPALIVTARRKTAPMRIKKSTAGNATHDDVFWCPSQAEGPPDNYTPGKVLLNVLFYATSGHLTFTMKPLTFPGVAGTYRNFLMTCAALMDQQFQTVYSSHLNDPLPPGVRNLQRWLEDAWEHGYDDVGASDFDRKLLGTKKKIGTGDLYVAFTSRKIPCVLVDFNLRKSSKGFDTVTEWVVNYFTEKLEGDVNKILCTASPIETTSKMPVIMQYDGHSMTIVGYELAKNGKYNLLVFDPSRKLDKDIRQAARNVTTNVDWAPSSSALLSKSRRHESKSPAPKKRSRTNRDADDVVSIRDSDDENTDDAHPDVALKLTLDPDKVIKAFRLKKPKKHDYQLLYFTMDDPLSDEEQSNRKVVLSVAEC